MPDPVRKFWKWLKRRVTAGLLLTMGFLMLVGNSCFKQFLNMYFGPSLIVVRLWEDVALGFFISGLLGITIDRVMKEAFMQDVFKAALGYPLPRQLRGQLETLYAQRLVCTTCTMNIKLRSIDDGCIRIDVEIRRRLENNGAEVESITPQFGTANYIGETNIEEFQIITSNATWIAPSKDDLFTDFKVERTGKTVEIQPNSWIEVACKWNGTRRIPDSYDEVFLTATQDLRVDVEASEDIEYILDIPKVGAKSTEVLGPNRRVLRFYGSEVLMPLVVISLRWRRKHHLDVVHTTNAVTSDAST